MTTPLMWKAVNSQFYFMKYLIPFPYSYNSSTHKLTYYPGLTRKTSPWYFLSSTAMILTFGCSGSVLLKQLLAPSEDSTAMPLLQVFSLAFFCVNSHLNLSCIWGQLVFGHISTKLFNEFVEIESQITGPKADVLASTFHKTQGKKPGPDICGRAMMNCVVFSAVYPFILASYAVASDFDPAFFITRPQFHPVLHIGSVILRLVFTLFTTLEIFRLLTFTILVGGIAQKLKGDLSTALYVQARQGIFLSFAKAYKLYVNVSLVLSMHNLSMGQLMFPLFAASWLGFVILGYCCIVMHAVVPMPYFLMFPVAFFITFGSSWWYLNIEVACYEHSKEMLRLWTRHSSTLRNRNMFLRQLKALLPLRFFVRLGTYSFFYYDNSAFITIEQSGSDHIINAVLVLPVN